jgi:uncharacterized protein YbjQ (UPF0145 family)
MAGARSGGSWGSALTTDEFAAVRSVGFEPVGQVFGAAVYAVGYTGGYGCPGERGSFGPLVEAMYQARHTAIDRMTAECAELGGQGVVGVRLSRGSFPLGGLEFKAIGTAVRAEGAVHGQQAPFTSDLSGQDFAKLIMMGWVPAGLALGISIGARHDDRATARQARWRAGNVEVAGWTELVNESRRDARRRLEDDVKRLGAEGVVIASMRMRVSERDCPVTVGRRDHIVEATFIGTAIARFPRAGERRAGEGRTGQRRADERRAGHRRTGERRAGQPLAIVSLSLARLYRHHRAQRQVAGRGPDVNGARACAENPFLLSRRPGRQPVRGYVQGEVGEPARG